MKIYDSKEYLVQQLKSKTYLQIAKELKVGKSTIQRKLKHFGLTKTKNLWSEKDLAKLEKNYSDNKRLFTLFPNRNKMALYRMAFKMGIKRPLRKRYHKVDEKFFKRWTKESSYLLGWMYSDGNVTEDKRTFRFHISKKDEGILKIFKKILKSEHKIFTHGNYAVFQVHSRKMCQDLTSLGCHPKKTAKIRFPKNMPKKYISHFVRGYFDGDGSIHFNYPNTIKITIVGNSHFIEELQKTVQNEIKINTSKVKKGNGNVWFFGM